MINSSSKLSILMCTYNGSHNISEQINSILAQSYKDFTLYIYDDGSTDDTVNIINRYIEKHPQTIKYIEDANKRKGAKNSFIWLMEQIDSDYYMFCDQDDIWLPFKICITINKIKEIESIIGNDKPIIVHSDLSVVDENLKIINNSFWNYSKLPPKLLTNFKNLQILNCVTGCAMGFNNSAKQCSIPMNKLAPMHDWWVALSTLKNNGVIFDIKTCTIKYRQHSKNVVGARNIGLKYVINKIRNLIKVIHENENHLKFLRSFSGMKRITFYATKFNLSLKRFYYATK